MRVFLVHINTNSVARRNELQELVTQLSKDLHFEPFVGESPVVGLTERRPKRALQTPKVIVGSTVVRLRLPQPVIAQVQTRLADALKRDESITVFASIGNAWLCTSCNPQEHYPASAEKCRNGHKKP